MIKSINIFTFLIASVLFCHSSIYSQEESNLITRANSTLERGFSLITKVNSIEECQQYIKDNRIVVVYFYNTRCTWCKRAAPVIELGALTYTKEVCYFIKIDTDEVPAIVDAFTLRSVPTILFFKNGIEVASRKHTLTFAEFQEIINSLQETI